MDPDRARFVSTAQLVEYLCDHLGLNQADLARRCGINPTQLSRWIRGDAEPSLSRLRSVLEPLGWTPVIGLRPTDAAVAEWLARTWDPEALLEWGVVRVLELVAAAGEQGVDVVIGGEVAAVLQGVPFSTRRMALLVREEYRERFVALARAERMWVGYPVRYPSDADQLDGEDPDPVVECGSAVASLRACSARPAVRSVRVEVERLRGRELTVVTLERLLAADHDDPVRLGPSAWLAAGRFADRVGRRAD